MTFKKRATDHLDSLVATAKLDSATGNWEIISGSPIMTTKVRTGKGIESFYKAMLKVARIESWQQID